MNKFINIRNGQISVTSYRHPEGQVTTLDDLITCAVAGDMKDMLNHLTKNQPEEV